MKKQILLLLLTLISVNHVFGQEYFQYKNIETKKRTVEERNFFDLGLGMGIEYSGFLGAQLEYAPIPRLGLFASGGFYLINVGWQLGAKAYVMPKVKAKSFRVYVTGMYGTNAAIVVEDLTEYDQVYVGPSFGVGVEMRFGNRKVNGLNLSLLYPVRSTEYENDLESIKNNPYIEQVQEPLPVGISVAYHREF